MAKKTECYVDTSAFIAFLDRSDSHHARFGQFFSDPPRLVTSAIVIAEGHGWFLRRYDRQRALQGEKLTLADSHGLAIVNERRIGTCWSTDCHLGLTGAALII
jgi:predicted nucleic acid-binding protein